MTVDPNFPASWGHPLFSAYQTSTLPACLNSCAWHSDSEFQPSPSGPPDSPYPRRMDSHKIRRAVERVVDLYCEIEYFGLQAAPLDPDTRISGGTASAGPDRHAKLWKSTVARILAALPLASRRALERGAGLRSNEYEWARNCAGLTRAISNPRIGNHRGKRADLTATSELANGIYALIRQERERLERNRSYTEAALLFWIECGERDDHFPAEDIRSFVFDEVEKRKRRVS